MSRIEMVCRGWYTEDLAINCAFSFDPDYPAAVEVTFIEARNVTWTFDRDLLAAGLFGRVGEGDVVISPKEEQLSILIRTGTGQAEILFDKTVVAEFVHATFVAVPRGEEFAKVDWDAELSNLTE